MIPTDEHTTRKFGAYSFWIGILLAILGTIGLVMPGLTSLFTAMYIGWLLAIGGVIWALHTWKYERGNLMNWLKPFILLLSGGLMIFYPLSGVAAVGLVLAVYLLLDAFGSLVLARELHPGNGWGWMLFNGIVSLLLAIMFLVGWPATSLFLVGIYVAISLIFDGWALIIVGWAMRKQHKA